MVLFRKASDLQNYLLTQRLKGVPIAFVPTMGALHAGHLHLVSEARKSGALAVVSIFVNPTQFNDPSDFEKYPVTIEEDIRLLEETGADLLFYPAATEIYPGGTRELEHYELGSLEELFEGSSRPGHFQGVCQVMSRLLNIVQPNELFMGQKDYQQCMVVKELIRQESLHTHFHTVPTVREADGLAMSSRNRRLSEEERQKAPAIYNAMKRILDKLTAGDTTSLTAGAEAELTAAGFKVDYISLADADTLEPCTVWDGQQRLVVVAAAFLGSVRLIDNLLMTR